MIAYRNGVVTAGNASQMSDGAAAVLVMSRGTARRLGMKPLAILRSFAVTGVPPAIMGVGPLYAIPRALEMAGLGVNDIDLYEVNEVSQLCQICHSTFVSCLHYHVGLCLSMPVLR